MRLTVYRLIGADFIFYCHNSQIVEPKLQALALHLIFSCDVTISQNNRYSNRRFIASQLQTNRNRYMYAKSTLHLQVHVPNVLMTHIFIIIIDFEYENRLTFRNSESRGERDRSLICSVTQERLRSYITQPAPDFQIPPELHDYRHVAHKVYTQRNAILFKI